MTCRALDFILKLAFNSRSHLRRSFEYVEDIRIAILGGDRLDLLEMKLKRKSRNSYLGRPTSILDQLKIVSLQQSADSVRLVDLMSVLSFINNLPQLFSTFVIAWNFS